MVVVGIARTRSSHAEMPQVNWPLTQKDGARQYSPKDIGAGAHQETGAKQIAKEGVHHNG